MRLLLLGLFVTIGACKPVDSAKSENSLFRLWTSDHGNATRDLTGKSIGYVSTFVNNGCTYEIRYQGTTAEFTYKTVDITNPADPSCFDYSSSDETYYYSGTSLRVCYTNGNQWTPFETDGCGRLH